MKEKNYMLSLTTQIGKTLKNADRNYYYDRLISMAFNGEGFYVNSNSKVRGLIKTWAYDIHWAYGGALLNEKFPTSCELINKETELGIYALELSYMKPKYEDFYYTLYQNLVDLRIGKSDKKIMFLTNIDYEIFQDLYKSDAKIINKWWFKDIDYLTELKPIIEKTYKAKKELKKRTDLTQDEKDNIKKIYEACFYGMFARKLNKDLDLKNPAAVAEYERALALTQYEDVRNQKTPIAMFQTAYLRKREWENFKKYKDHVIYMNTDSIYTDCKIDLPIGNNIGEYGLEYEKVTRYIRRNAYLVLEDDLKTVYKSVVGGCIDKKEDFTPDKIEDLNNGNSVRVHTKNEKGELTWINLKPLFNPLYYVKNTDI